MGVADGDLYADGEKVYSAENLKVGLLNSFEESMRRVVITGIGIVSSIGSNAEEVKKSLLIVHLVFQKLSGMIIWDLSHKSMEVQTLI